MLHMRSLGTRSSARLVVQLDPVARQSEMQRAQARARRRLRSARRRLRTLSGGARACLRLRARHRGLVSAHRERELTLVRSKQGG